MLPLSHLCATMQPVELRRCCDGMLLVAAGPGLWRELAIVGFGDEVPGDAVTDGHGDAVTSGDLPVTSGDLPGDARVARRRAVSRRSSAKYRAKLKALATLARNDPQSYPVTRPAAALKKEEEDDLLPSEEARARASDDAALLADTAAWPLGYQRKIGWGQSVMRRAEALGLLSRAKSAELWQELGLMRPDRSLKNWGLPRRANDELDRLDRVLAERGSSEQARLPLPPVPAPTGPPRAPPSAAAAPSSSSSSPGENNMQRCAEALARFAAGGTR